MPHSLDTETALVSNDEPVPRLALVQIFDGSSCVVYPAHRVDWDHVVHVLRHGPTLANAPYDMFALWRARPELGREILDAYDRGDVWDVITREKVIAAVIGDRRKRFSLDEIAKHRAGIVLAKDEQVRRGFGRYIGRELAEMPPDAVQYARDDVIATYRVRHYQEREGIPMAHCDVHASAHLALYAQTLRGIRTDLAYVERLDRSLAARIEALAYELLPTGLVRIEGKRKTRLVGTPAEAQRRMVEHCSRLGISPRMTDPTPKNPHGQVSLDGKALRHAKLPKDHPLSRFSLYKSLNSHRTKNIPVFRRGLVRCRYDECKVTARTGASKPQGNRKLERVEPWEWVGTNLQNFARPDTLLELGFDEGEGFRECLIPPEGHSFVITDYPQLEMRTHAQVLLRLFGRSKLAEVLRDPKRDPHSETGARIAGVPIELFDRKNNHEHAKARQLAKPANFGFPGGLGIARFIEFAAGPGGGRIEIDEATARRLKQAWLDTYPEMRDYFDWIESLRISPDLYRITIPGTQLTRTCKRNDACNFTFQGLAALIAKTALWYLFRASLEPSSPLFGCGQVLFVHDENVTVVPHGREEAAAREQERLMAEAARVWMPDIPVHGMTSSIVERYGK